MENHAWRLTRKHYEILEYGVSHEYVRPLMIPCEVSWCLMVPRGASCIDRLYSVLTPPKRREDQNTTGTRSFMASSLLGIRDPKP